MPNLLSSRGYITTVLLFSSQLVMPTKVLADNTLVELPSLDFEALMATDVQVTSAMKRLQNKSETAASIYVLTNEEITQSGVTSVAQALTLVPGMQVRKIDNNQWAITSRSVAGRYSSKLLVMIDGQSIYNPGFAGVYWEALNIPLYDIERIEVIRGQGGILWGSNATNGVINIITKHTADTRNVVGQVATGSKIDHKIDLRVGGDLDNYSSFRVFAGVEDTDESSKSRYSISPNDNSKKQNIGARIDLKLTNNLSFLTQADYTHIELGQNIILADLNTYSRTYYQEQYTRDHFQLMARLEHKVSPDSNQMLQASISSQRGEQRHYKDQFLISDIDYQMNTLINNIQFDWGLNYRYNDISLENSDYVFNLQNINSYNQFGGFVQAQFTILPDQLKLILGNRTEKNSFTEWQHQPMARLVWTPHLKHSIWGAVSQGVRIPSLAEYNERILVSSSYGIRTEIIGNANIKSEKSISKELGYRYTANSWWLDVSLFHTKSYNVLAVDPSINATYSLISLDLVSEAELVSYGGEAIIKWQPFDKLSTELGYSLSSNKYELYSDLIPALGNNSYLRQIIAKTNFSLTDTHSFSAIYRIESGDAYSTDNFSVLDLSWNWQVTPVIAFSLIGNNLLYGSHLQHGNGDGIFTVGSFVEPSYLAKITAKF